MKAVRFHEYGGPEVLRYEDVDVPVPTTGQVRLRVAATTFNGVDGNIRAGYMQDPMPLTLPHVPGLDVAGTIDALGPDVAGLQLGAAVVGFLPFVDGRRARRSTSSRLQRTLHRRPPASRLPMRRRCQSSA